MIKKGDVVVFNNKHKIYCGDSTLESSYDFFDFANITVTSPPYNVGKNNCSTKKYENYQDTDTDYTKLLESALTRALEKTQYVFWNIQHLSGNKIPLIEWLYKFRTNFVDTIIWNKTTPLPAMEPNVMNSNFEYIYVFKDQQFPTKHITSGEEFRGTKQNVINIDRNTQNRYAEIHRALFPIDLSDYLVENFSNRGDEVLDCFSGLGTTMISCIKHGRTYYGIELDEYYIEETIKRIYYEMNIKDIYIKRGNETIPYEVIENELGLQPTLDLF